MPLTVNIGIHVSSSPYEGDFSGYSWQLNGDDPELLAKLYKMADDLYRQVTERKLELCQK